MVALVVVVVLMEPVEWEQDRVGKEESERDYSRLLVCSHLHLQLRRVGGDKMLFCVLCYPRDCKTRSTRPAEQMTGGSATRRNETINDEKDLPQKPQTGTLVPKFVYRVPFVG